MSFAPAVSDKAAKAMRQRIRRWRLHHRNDLALEEIARWVQPVLTGWARYYGRFHSTALRRVLRTVDDFLLRWAQPNTKDSGNALREPGVGCAECKLVSRTCSRIGLWYQRLDDRSRMNRKVHVRFWEGLEVRFPGATQLSGQPIGFESGGDPESLSYAISRSGRNIQVTHIQIGTDARTGFFAKRVSG